MRINEFNNIKDFIKTISKAMDVKVTYRNLTKLSARGVCIPRDRVVRMDNQYKQYSAADYLSAFFHEINHIIAFDNNKYIRYHDYTLIDDVPRSQVINLAVRAERYVDNCAKVMFNEYFPMLQFVAGYGFKYDTITLKMHFFGW